MKKFVFTVFYMFLLAVLGFFFVLSLANGYTDPFYIRFTTPKQTNLIIGTSRAAQGLQPSVLRSQLGTEFFNYSFSIMHSPFGPTYLKSIKKKLDTTKSGIFIITVDPWSISSKTANPNDSINFREVMLCLGNTQKVNSKPNFQYLFKNLDGRYHNILMPNRLMYLHNDGWLELSISMDSVSVKKRLLSKIDSYRRNDLPLYKFSELRFNYLKETINYLKAYGAVYLVRLPMHPELFEIEEELMPDFNKKIEELALFTEGYYDMTSLNSSFVYTDGNHLYKKSGQEVSLKLSLWIQMLQQRE